MQHAKISDNPLAGGLRSVQFYRFVVLYEYQRGTIPTFWRRRWDSWAFVPRFYPTPGARFESIILHGITAVIKKGLVDCGDKLVTIEEEEQNSQGETCRRCVVTDGCASIPRTCRAVASYLKVVCMVKVSGGSRHARNS